MADVGNYGAQQIGLSSPTPEIRKKPFSDAEAQLGAVRWSTQITFISKQVRNRVS
jgi:hypothetical protein